MLRLNFKKTCSLLFTFLIFLSCSDEENDPCEGLILDDVITQTLIIKLVDDNGNNLIENETYDKEYMFHERNGIIRKPIVYNEAEFSNLQDELKNVIVLRIGSNGDSENIWTIHLSEEEKDTLELDLELKSTGCSGLFYDILDIIYDESSINFEDIGNNTYKITVLK